VLHDGVSATLSYVDSDRAVLPEGCPKAVPAAVSSAGMLCMFYKLARIGAKNLWLSACAPQWLPSKNWRYMHADHYLVATSGDAFGEPIPAGLTREQAEQRLIDFQTERTKDLAARVYPTLLEHAHRLGLVAGAGRYLSTPGMGGAVPPFVDELVTKVLLTASEETLEKARKFQKFQSTSPLADAALEVTNAASPVFFAFLALPDALANKAAEYAMRLAPDTAAFCAMRSDKFNKKIREAMALKAMPRWCADYDYHSLGQVARLRLRAFYLAEQKKALKA
jgi:hypothetical protein